MQDPRLTNNIYHHFLHQCYASGAHNVESMAHRHLGYEISSESSYLALSQKLKLASVIVVVQGTWKEERTTSIVGPNW